MGVRRLVLLLTLLIAPSAEAARWQTPQVVSAAGGHNAQIRLDARGDALAVWESFAKERPGVWYAWRPPRGKWTEPRQLTALGGSARGGAAVTLSPLGVATVAYMDERKRLTISEARPGRAFAVRQHIDAREPYGFVLAAGDSGQAVLAWTEPREGARVMAAVRGASGGFGTPQELARGASTPEAAMNPAGAAVVAWTLSSGARAQAAYRLPAAPFGPPTDFPALSTTLHPQVAIDALGRAVVAGTAFVPVGNGSGGTGYVQSTPLGEWGEVRGLDAAGVLLGVTADPGGGVSMLSRIGGPPRPEGDLHLASRLADGSLVPPAPIARGVCDGDVRSDLLGARTGVWTRPCDLYSRGTRVYAARRGPLGGWSPEVPISGPDATFARVAVNEGGEAMAVWSRATTSGDLGSAAVEAAAFENPGLPALPFPPDVDLDVPGDYALPPTGDLPVDVRCDRRCEVRTGGTVVAGPYAVAAPGGSRRTLKARRRGRLNVRFGSQLAGALRGARGAYVVVTVTARGASRRPVSVSRRVRLR